MTKVLLVALFAIMFFAVAPSVSASAATGGAPDCSTGTCAQPAPVQTLEPKDPSQEVDPPQGWTNEGPDVSQPLAPSVPNPIGNGDDCSINDPCTHVSDPDQNVHATVVKIVSTQYLAGLQFRSTMFLIIDLVLAALCIAQAITIIRTRRRPEPKVEDPGHSGTII